MNINDQPMAAPVDIAAQRQDPASKSYVLLGLAIW